MPPLDTGQTMAPPYRSKPSATRPVICQPPIHFLPHHATEARPGASPVTGCPWHATVQRTQIPSHDRLLPAECRLRQAEESFLRDVGIGIVLCTHSKPAATRAHTSGKPSHSHSWRHIERIGEEQTPVAGGVSGHSRIARTLPWTPPVPATAGDTRRQWLRSMPGRETPAHPKEIAPHTPRLRQAACEESPSPRNPDSRSYLPGWGSTRAQGHLTYPCLLPPRRVAVAPAGQKTYWRPLSDHSS